MPPAPDGSLDAVDDEQYNRAARASGGSYLAPTATSLNSPGPNRATFSFTVAAGDYTLWGRTVAPSPDDDSLWVSVDGASFFRWNSIAQSSNWAWRQVHNSDAGGALVNFSLSEGTHTLVIANREDGVQLDRLYLTADGDTP